MRRIWDRLSVRVPALIVLLVLVVAVSVTLISRHVSTFEPYSFDRVVALIAIIGVVVAIVLGVGSALGLTRPIRRATEAARRFGAGELDVRLPARGRTELAELGAAFNAMAAQLADTLRDLHESQTLQQRFVADVSHELRTPLAALLAADDGLDSSDETARGRSILLVREQTQRLATMVDDLLEMSRFDAGQVSMNYEQVDLASLASDVVRTVAPDGDVRITPLGDTQAEVDVRRIHTVLRNLVGNAFQHGRPPVDIVIDGRDPASVVLTVADDGPGVPPEFAASVFDRFVRADEARTSQGAHNGLGLAIALENAKLHGGTLSLATSGRTAFTLNLPRLTGDDTGGRQNERCDRSADTVQLGRPRGDQAPRRPRAATGRAEPSH